MTQRKTAISEGKKQKGFLSRLKGDFIRFHELYIIIIPVIVYYFLFTYRVGYGALIAFQDYDPIAGFVGSPWVGLKHFKNFFSSPDVIRLLRNTLTINITNLVFGFPTPIIFALLLNELRQLRFKKLVQTVTYLPHFISMVVMCGIIRMFVDRDGIVTQIVTFFTGKEGNLLNYNEMFVPIYIISGIWAGLGWNSIIYVAALTSIDEQLYEAATIDGANRWKQTIYITIPGIWPTVAIMLILKIGSLLSSNGEQILLLYNSLIYETSDVVGTYVYRRGLEGQQWSYTTAVGLVNTVVNVLLTITANYISRKTTEASLW